MKRLVNGLLHHWPIIVLILVELALFATNYTPGTFVVGWDNMYPELNFGLNFKRAFFGVWQEYRGLGVEDGLSHAAQLPHYVFLWLLSVFVPQNLLRYVFIFFMHLVGGIGMYTLLKKHIHAIAAFIGTLFYQYNFATVQMFYLPFEVFMVHFASLPWLLWAAVSYLDHGGRRYALWLTILSLVATPQAHVPTVFLVYLMALAIILIIHLATHRSKAAWKRTLIIVAITFSVNAFWGLPYIHNTLAHAGDIANSKNNQMATDDIFAKNQRYGDLPSAALMRSFSLDYVQYDHTTGTQSFMFAPWKVHVNSFIQTQAAGVFFGLALIGTALVVFRQKKAFYPYVALFVFSFLIIGNDIPILSGFSETLRATIPLFHNVFRFVFTKFFTLYSLAYSILIAVAIFEIAKAVHHTKRDSYILVSIFVVLLTWYSWPSFQGNFFYKNLRVAIPKEYFETFRFLSKRDPSERVAVLPAPWFWAWTQYRWGVIGSGFQWFGIPQPLVDRAFDPWSKTNENFYWQMSQAIYTKKPDRLLSVLGQHDVSWILFDENIINASYDRAQYTDDIRQMLDSSPNVTKSYQSGKITVYRIAHQTIPTSWVRIATDVPNIGPASSWNDNDQAYVDYSDYMSDSNLPYDNFYPFRSLFTGRLQNETAFTVEEDSTSFILTVNGPSDQLFSSRIPKPNGPLTYDSAQTQALSQPPKSCDGYNTGLFTHESRNDADTPYVRLKSIKSSNCLTFDAPALSQRYGYIVAVEYRPIEGRALSLSITNKETRRAFLETLLTPRISRDSNAFETAWLIVPPMDPYGLGYSITIDNIAIGRKTTINDIRRVRIYPIPYDVLTQTKSTQTATPSAQMTQPMSVSHPNPAYYKIIMDNKQEAINENQTLILSQSFDSGWIAVTPIKQFPFLAPLGEHVLVNNWANGWTFGPTSNTRKTGYLKKQNSALLNNQVTIYLFFWPQLLEFLGFSLLPIPFIFAVRKTQN